MVLGAATAGAPSTFAAKMYWAQSLGDRVIRAETDGTEIETVLEWPQLDDPVAIGLDAASGKIYWAQLFGDRIVRAGLDGGNIETLLEWPELDNPHDLALDVGNGKLYWVEGTGTSSLVQRSDLDGSNAQVLASWPTVSDPHAIAIDAVGGSLYWAEGVAEESAVYRANLDGTGTWPVIVWPLLDDVVALAIDSGSGKIYWAQTFEDRIQRANLDGSNVEPLIAWPVADDIVDIALDTDNGKIYWAQSFGDRILRADLNGGSAEPLLEWPDVAEPVSLVLDLTAPPPCPAPTVVSAGPRYVRITPAPGPDPVGLQVRGDALDPTVACVSLYVQAPARACVGGASHGRTCGLDGDCPGGSCQRSATLGAVPVFLTPTEWGVVNVYAAGLRPSTRYEIRTDCAVADGPNLSVGVGTVTWLWGDVDHSATCNAGLKAGLPCNRSSDCPDGECLGVSFADVYATVMGYKGLFSPTITTEATDLYGADCVPNRDVNFIDISKTVDAYKSIALSCAPPCMP